MIKAIFFDLYNTIITYDPPREELQAAAFREFGIEVAPEKIRKALLIADEYFYQENSRSPVGKRSQEEKMAVYTEYESIILREVGVKVPPKVALQLLMRLREFDMKLVLFNDVLPALGTLKKKGLILGLISNIDRDITPLCDELGLTPYLDLSITSQEVGSDKPHPPIFLAALERAGVAASEAMHVGDQYQVDVKGAQGVGIKGVLLDRGGFFKNITDCPRIRSLTEITGHL